MFLDEELYVYHVILDKESSKTCREIYSWCVETLGQPQNLNKESNWIYTTVALQPTFKFKNEADRNWFLLKWG
jgi:hypothetical protein